MLIVLKDELIKRMEGTVLSTVMLTIELLVELSPVVLNDRILRL